MEQLLLLTLCGAVWLQVLCTFPQYQKESLYRKCNRGTGIFQGNVIRTMTSTELRCFEWCTMDDRCQSLNVCPSSQEGQQSQCQMLDSYSPWFCKKLHQSTPTTDHCYHAEKVSKCQNGGRVRDNGTCKCDVCFKGSQCKEHVRDCEEAVDVLAADGGYDSPAMCSVQPSTSPQPFFVRCPFAGSKLTALIFRVQTDTGWSQLDWKVKTWNDFKMGMGSYDKYNFFVGLENMRNFLNQAEYRLNLYNTYHHSSVSAQDMVQPSYRNVTLQNEDNKYALSYSVYTNSKLTTTDVESFQGSDILHPFCTQDNDCGTCARDNGSGWYYIDSNGDCVGASPFAPVAKWPYEGEGMLIIDATEYFMERIGDFY